MNYFGRLVSNVKGFYDEINAATLTGAIDVVVVEQPDGTFLGSPFHVRFGKLGVLQSREKVVDIEVNGVAVNLHMKLGPAGEAFFVEQLDREETIPYELATSPIPSEYNLMARGIEKLHNDLLNNDSFQDEPSKPIAYLEEGETTPNIIIDSQICEDPKDEDLTEPGPSMEDQIETDKTGVDDHAISRSISIPILDKERRNYPLSDSDDQLCLSPPNNLTRAQRIGMYPLSDLDSPITSPLMSDLSDALDRPNLRNVLSDTEAEIGPKQLQNNALYDEGMTWQWGELPQPVTTTELSKTLNEKGHSSKRRKSTTSLSSKTQGLYLEDVISSNKEVADLYLNRSHQRVEDGDSGFGHDSQPRSPVSTTDDKSTHDNTLEQSFPQDFSLSLCGNLKHPRYPPDHFFEQLISFEEFCLNPLLLSDPKLVIRIDNKYFNWQVAAPYIMSYLVYQRPLEKSALRSLKRQYMPKKRRGWFSWRTNNDELESSDEEESNLIRTGRAERHRHHSLASDESVDSDRDEIEKYKKVTRLSSDQWQRLHLRHGANDVMFSVTTRYQGTALCTAKIYFWRYSDKIVISDIDGTITRSDVLGQMLPLVGKDWSQSGVAPLFSKIEQNGYHFMYLSARAIGQAKITRDFLRSVRQGELTLPDGPVLLSPTSLMKAFQKEVIERKPEEFKIACMRNIKSLFPDSYGNPFFSGFGNRINDVWAYRDVGIPISRIFTINYKGEIRHELTNAFTTSYSSLIELVDQMFPPLTTDRAMATTSVEFSAFAYWRLPIKDSLIEDIEGNEDHPKVAEVPVTSD